MKKRNAIIGGALALSFSVAPLAANAGWASRTSENTVTAIAAPTFDRLASDGDQYRLPTRADRVQGRPAYQAFANSPYATQAAAPVSTSGPADPSYFDTVMGSSRF